VNRPDLEINEEKLLEATKFMAKLAVAGVIFRAIIAISPNTYFLESFLAFLTGNIIQIFEKSTRIVGNRIIIDSSIFVVTQDCLGWKSIAAFIGLSWASKLYKSYKILFAGVIAISIANVVRIVSTVLLAQYSIISFEIIHGLLWRWGLTFLVFVLWGYWLWKTK